MNVYIYPGSSITGGVGEPLGPFPYVTLTLDLVRGGNDREDTDDLGRLDWVDGLWHMADGQIWTDLTISAEVPS